MNNKLDKYLNKCIDEEVIIDFSYDDGKLLGSINSFEFTDWKYIHENMIEINNDIKICFDDYKIHDEFDRVFMFLKDNNQIVEIVLVNENLSFYDEEDDKLNNIIEFLENIDCNNCPEKIDDKTCTYINDEINCCPIGNTIRLLNKMK